TRRLENGEPDIRYCFIPAAEGEILDTWHVRGLRGTGTHHFRVDDVFVPEERTCLVAGAPLREPGPLYVLPRTLLFASGDAAVCLGIARSSLEALYELAGAKMPRAAGGLLRDLPLVQSQVGHAEAHLRSGRALLTETVRETWEALTSEGDVTVDQRVALRLAATHAMRLSAKVVDIAYDAGGATAAYLSSPIQRCFQDIHVATQHIQARLAHYEMVGRYYLGGEPDLSRL
ncbi:MAG TPA: acyl-CoA dehydrogenase family protein, partial [Dehalococcoidia bacterium]|nr:acyl-CoA dehydrogenase family protein [Dehalococcoidia bacterium]